MATVNMPIDELTKQITVTVTIGGYRGWLARLVLGKFLVWLGLVIIGTKVEFVREGNWGNHI